MWFIEDNVRYLVVIQFMIVLSMKRDKRSFNERRHFHQWPATTPTFLSIRFSSTHRKYIIYKYERQLLSKWCCLSEQYHIDYHYQGHIIMRSRIFTETPNNLLHLIAESAFWVLAMNSNSAKRLWFWAASNSVNYYLTHLFIILSHLTIFQLIPKSEMIV